VRGTARRNARAEVEELAHARRPAVADGVAQERPLRAGHERQLRVDPDCLLGERAVGGVVVRTTQIEVMDPCGVRPTYVDLVACEGGDRSHSQSVTGA
jgi:hypothetical protein